MSSKTLPLECSNKSSPWYSSDCENPETNANDLALTKLAVEVVGGVYGSCEQPDHTLHDVPWLFQPAQASLGPPT